MQLFRGHVLVCGGTGCTSTSSKEVQAAFTREMENNKLDKEIKLVETGCHGFCEMGPLVIVYPEGTFYVRVTPEDVPEIVRGAPAQGADRQPPALQGPGDG